MIGQARARRATGDSRICHATGALHLTAASQCHASIYAVVELGAWFLSLSLSFCVCVRVCAHACARTRTCLHNLQVYLYAFMDVVVHAGCARVDAYWRTQCNFPLACRCAPLGERVGSYLLLVVLALLLIAHLFRKGSVRPCTLPSTRTHV